MKTAKDIMTKDPMTIGPDEEVLKAARILIEKKINGLPVVSEGKLIGIICQSDLVHAQRKFPIPSLFTVLDGFIPLGSINNLEKEWEKIAARTVSQAMTKNPVTVTPDTSLEDLASVMVEKKFHTLPVVEGENLVGVVGKEDVLKTLIG